MKKLRSVGDFSRVLYRGLQANPSFLPQAPALSYSGGLFTEHEVLESAWFFGVELGWLGALSSAAVVSGVFLAL
ncbi:MAG: hypothetical protein V4719_28775 [Planctomycetota bacterium]